MERLVTRAAAGDESDLALDRRVLPDDDLVVEVDAQQVAVRGREAGERLLDDVVRGVDELLHGNGCNAHLRSLLDGCRRHHGRVGFADGLADRPDDLARGRHQVVEERGDGRAEDVRR